MDTTTAVKSLNALAQSTRLEAFRLLVMEGEAGLAAGRIASALNVPHNTLSTHLGILENAGLVQARRESRSIIYSVDFGGTRALMGFLMKDCCQGSAELCQPVLDNIVPACCGDNISGDQNETNAH